MKFRRVPKVKKINKSKATMGGGGGNNTLHLCPSPFPLLLRQVEKKSGQHWSLPLSPRAMARRGGLGTPEETAIIK